MSIKQILLLENINANTVYYHGTRSLVPFDSFDKHMDGSGIVTTGGKKYGGAFFTTEKNNAEYFADYLITEVSIKNVEEYTGKNRSPVEVLKQATEENKIYAIMDIMDGSTYSDIVVVPYSRYDDITIIKWTLNVDYEDWIETIVERFGVEDEDDPDTMYINGDMIDSFYRTVGMDLQKILKLSPDFKEFYEMIEWGHEFE